MNELKQTQKSGDNSVQNQIGTQIIVGIDESVFAKSVMRR